MGGRRGSGLPLLLLRLKFVGVMAEEPGEETLGEGVGAGVGVWVEVWKVKKGYMIIPTSF